MVEYIDKKKIIDKLSEELDILVEEGHMPEGYLTALSLIETIQAEDVVSVVRCKDCKHWLNKTGIGWCEINSRMSLDGHWNPFYENDYCSYGERKTDEKGT